MTTQAPGGPALPSEIHVTLSDFKYPKVTGEIERREAITNYCNMNCDAGITPDNLTVFAGGRPEIPAMPAFLQTDVCVAIEETE